MDQLQIQELLAGKIKKSQPIDRLWANSKFQNADFVLLGESSHGTREFYKTRAQISQRLIEEKGFRSVVVEADWPDMYRVNRYVQHRSKDDTSEASLSDFKRFPTWMWRNEEFIEFVDWLRDFNKGRDESDQVGVYGMDLYSMERSITEVIRTVAQRYPEYVDQVEEYYSCFDHRSIDPQQYGQAAWLGQIKGCEEEVLAALKEIQRKRREETEKENTSNEDSFSAEQNARVVAGSESYYRSLFEPQDNSWNIRDTHMVDTVRVLSEHRGRLTSSGRCVLWAHNSHLGDSRATEMSSRGELNVGHLMRETYGDRCFSLGFSTSRGEVVAARNWDSPASMRRVRTPIEGSIEKLLSGVGPDEFLVDMHDSEVAKALEGAYLERAIGVIYRPETERWSHYFHADLPKQFDALWHIEETHALRPLDPLAKVNRDYEMEAFPSGL